MAKSNEPINQNSSRMALGIAFEFALGIALPLLAGILLGKWADSHFHTTYWKYIGIFAAFITTVLWLYRTLRKITIQYQQDMKNQEPNNRSDVATKTEKNQTNHNISD